MENKQAQNGYLSFAAILFLIFLVLKLTKHIDWSWWWVFAPLWMPTVFALALIAVLFILTKK